MTISAWKNLLLYTLVDVVADGSDEHPCVSVDILLGGIRQSICVLNEWLTS